MQFAGKVLTVVFVKRTVVGKVGFGLILKQRHTFLEVHFEISGSFVLNADIDQGAQLTHQSVTLIQKGIAIVAGRIVAL